MALRGDASITPFMREGLISSQIVSMIKFKSSQLLKLLSFRRTIVSRQAIAEYIKGLIKLYKEAKKQKKSEYLDQAEVITGKSRRTVQRYLSGDASTIQPGTEIRGRGRKTIYSAEILLPHIRNIWKAMEMIS